MRVRLKPFASLPDGIEYKKPGIGNKYTLDFDILVLDIITSRAIHGAHLVNFNFISTFWLIILITGTIYRLELFHWLSSDGKDLKHFEEETGKYCSVRYLNLYGSIVFMMYEFC